MGRRDEVFESSDSQARCSGMRHARRCCCVPVALAAGCRVRTSRPNTVTTRAARKHADNACGAAATSSSWKATIRS